MRRASWVSVICLLARTDKVGAYTIVMSGGKGLMRSVEAEDRLQQVADTVVGRVFDGVEVSSGE
jgi:hypothetical protein